MFGKPKLVLIILSASVVLYGLVGGLLRDVSAEEDTYAQLEMFTMVLSRLKEEYVENPEMDRAINGALLGMIEAVDPFSSFVQGNIFSGLQRQEGAPASPGLVLSKRYGYAYVVAVFPGSSAYQVGLRTGDIVESVENMVTTEMSLWETRTRLKGSQGTDVSIRVVRPRRSRPMEIRLKREVIKAGQAQAIVVEDSIGLLSIPNFNRGISQEVLSKIRLLLATGVKAILVDVRGTTDGTIEESVLVADLFLEPDQLIASVASRDGTTKEYRSAQKDVTSDLIVGLLLDGGTSGPAEIFAAALIDNKDVFSIGSRTNGQGSIQERFDLGDGSVIFLATRLIVRPNGKLLQGKTMRSSGVQPEQRSPSQNFVTSFYFDNATEDLAGENVAEFYRKLDEVVGLEQLERGLEEIRKRLFKKAA